MKDIEHNFEEEPVTYSDDEVMFLKRTFQWIYNGKIHEDDREELIGILNKLEISNTCKFTTEEAVYLSSTVMGMIELNPNSDQMNIMKNIVVQFPWNEGRV